MVRTEARNASLGDLRDLLVEQHARKIDVVAHASKIRSQEGLLVVEGTESVLSEDGVTMTAGTYRPTAVCDEGISQKLQIPLPYMRRLRDERPDLYDANVNGWLHGRREKRRLAPMGTAGDGDGYETMRPAIPGDDRSFMLRCFRGDDDQQGIARAFLSDRYKVVDNLDALTAALDGVRAAGVAIEIDGCDLTDRRMYVRVKAPEVQALAPTLLKNYRSPFSGKLGADNPTVFAGFEISNSETGGGAFTITPRMVIEVCNNGMKITKDALRAVHLGGRQEEGVIRWSEDTQQKTIDLITAKTRDAVQTFLDIEYMQRVIEAAEEKSEVAVKDPAKQVQVIGKALTFSKSTIDGVLDHFIKGADATAGGLMNAVTSFARTVENADDAADIEAQAFRALEMAAAIR